MFDIKVSFVIPVYNQEKYLRECIESVLNQTYKDIEVIAVNDGSTDKSLKILQSYSNKIKIINKSNGGTGSALNTGIKAMTGEWFRLFASDDVLYEDATQIMMDEIEKLGDKARDYVIATNAEWINENGKKIHEYLEPPYNNLSRFDRNSALLTRFVGNATTWLIHKSVFEKFGIFTEKLPMQEDYEFVLRLCLLHNCRVWLIPKITVKYRRHEGSTAKRINKNPHYAELHRRKVRDTVLDQVELNLQKKYKRYIQHYVFKIRTKKFLRRLLSIFPTPLEKKLLDYYYKMIKK